MIADVLPPSHSQRRQIARRQQDSAAISYRENMFTGSNDLRVEGSPGQPGHKYFAPVALPVRHQV